MPMNFQELPSGLFIPQTQSLMAQSAELRHRDSTHPADSLTPRRLAEILVASEKGDLREIADLYDDMEERDGHLLGIMSKRRWRVAGLDWDIVAPDPKNQQQLKNALVMKRLIRSIPNFYKKLFDLSDAIGKGISALEIEWRRTGGYWVPHELHSRPLGMFRINLAMQEPLRLLADEVRVDDGSPEGARLNRFGWIVHQVAARTGNLARSALYRSCVWPYLYRRFSLADWLEFLEVYGYPIRIGTYREDASKEERASLMRAVIDIGRRAGGIVPTGSDIKLMDATDGNPEAFARLVEWCDKTQSKLVSGGTLTSEADGKSSTNALGNVHADNETMLMRSDAKILAETLSRQLLWPMAILNGLADSTMESSLFVFDTQQTEDLTKYAQALPPLVQVGVRIPRKWANQRLRIPDPEAGEEVLSISQTQTPGNAGFSALSAVGVGHGSACPHCNPLNAFNLPLTAASGVANDAANAKKESVDDLLPNLQKAADGEVAGWIAALSALVDQAQSMEELQQSFLDAFGQLPTDKLTQVMAAGMALAQLRGMQDVLNG